MQKDRQEKTKEKKKVIRTVLKRERYESLFCVHMKSYVRLSYQMGWDSNWHLEKCLSRLFACWRDKIKVNMILKYNKILS